MKFFDDLKQKSTFNKLKKGKISLKDLSEEQRDDEDFVRTAIEANGIQEFAYASKRIRSNANFIVEYANYVLKAIEANGIEEFEKVDYETATTLDFLLVMYSAKPEVAKYFTTVYAPDNCFGDGKLVSSASTTNWLVMEFAPEIFKHLPLNTARSIINDYSYMPFVDNIEDREGNLLETPKTILAMPEENVMAEIKDILAERIVKEVILPSNNPIERISHDEFAAQAYAKYVAKEIEEKGLEEFEKVDEDVKTFANFLYEIYKLKPEVAKYLTKVYSYDTIAPTDGNTLVTSAGIKTSLINEFAPEIFKYLPLNTAEWVIDSYKSTFVDYIEDKEGNILMTPKTITCVFGNEELDDILKIVAERKANEIEDDGIADE